jgi:hypothetical protein
MRLASSLREYDKDTTILVRDNLGIGTIGNDLDGKIWMGPWTVKVFTEGDVVETMTIELKLLRK